MTGCIRATTVLVAASLLGAWLPEPAGAASSARPAGAETAAAARAQGEDFDALWRAIDSGYAYFPHGRAQWRRAREGWRREAIAARGAEAFNALLERALASLNDDHVYLVDRRQGAPRRVPQEWDAWAGWNGPRAMVEAVRTYGDFDVAGIRPGHEVVAIDGVPVERAVRTLLPARDAAEPRARDWALRHALAGPSAGVLKVQVSEGGRTRTLEVARNGSRAARSGALVARRIGEARDLGYLRLKGHLDDAALAAQFEAALTQARGTRALIIDLRDTPGEGSRAATLAILGHFVTATAPWQVRQGADGTRRIDSVEPRGTAYRAPLVVLVDRWTAGEAEALAAGLRAAAGARLVGTRMAGLRGELHEVSLPRGGARVRFPAERSLLPDGTAREALRPDVEVNLAAPDGGPGDPILYQALKLFERK